MVQNQNRKEIVWSSAANLKLKELVGKINDLKNALEESETKLIKLKKKTRIEKK